MKLESYIAIDPPHFAFHEMNSIAIAYLLHEIASKKNAPIICITDSTQAIENLTDAFQFFNLNELPLLHFPDWETLPYDRLSPHKAIISERLSTLYQLPFFKKGVLMTSVSTILHRLLPKNYLQSHGLHLKINQTFSMQTFREQLINSGYHLVEQVMEYGEFAVRGSILDIFPAGNQTPYRIEWFDDIIDSIRSFDPETQLSLQKFDAIHLLPAHEYPLTKESIESFRNKWREKFSGNPNHSPMYVSISAGERTAGAEYYLPLFYEATSTFLDYLPENAVFVLINDVKAAADSFLNDIKIRYQQLSADTLYPLCAPNELFIAPSELLKNIETAKLSQDFLKTHALPDLQIRYAEKNSFQKLNQFISSYSGRILFCAETAGRREILLELLRQIHVLPKQYENWQSF